MAAKKLQVGWYGLGSMGKPMAENLQKYLAKNDQSLIFNNRTMASGDSLKGLGASPASSFGELVTKSDVIFTMVNNDDTLKSLLQQAYDTKDLSGKIFVDCSTVHPDTTKAVTEEITKHKATYLAAPMFGGPAIAVPGKLVVAIGGPSSAVETVKPYFQDVIARKVIVCKEEPQSASMLKIAGNIITVNLMEAVSEAQVFAEQTGIGCGPMEELITEGFGPVAGGYSGRMTSGNYAPALDKRPGFGVSLSIKDANYALAIAEEKGVKLPATEIANKNMKAARDEHGEVLDCASMYGTLRKEAGLNFFNDKSRQSDDVGQHQNDTHVHPQQANIRGQRSSAARSLHPSIPGWFARLVVIPRPAFSMVSRTAKATLPDTEMAKAMVKEVMARVSGGAVAGQGATVTVDSPRSDYQSSSFMA
ncbi:3-hydroxyisobutyrate dehydrogenase [Aureobasidium pullulans]|uniref:3-hydroxyisobutyrate dehydrogenase n=1 Tax=Aureobasidium pullulans TaxID=5580 RepID=A0AB74ILB9_AURPU|nr:3-hydroxyisobutyrate dehydrogenase [Aureobasidium pullulans]